MTDDIIVFL